MGRSRPPTDPDELRRRSAGLAIGCASVLWSFKGAPSAGGGGGGNDGLMGGSGSEGTGGGG